MNKKDLSDIVKVTAAILVKDNKIIIAKRGPDDRLANKWEFPGGKIEIHETPEQCLKREMKEEFDIDVSVGEYLGSSIFTSIERKSRMPEIQGIMGEAVVIYCEPLITKEVEYNRLS